MEELRLSGKSEFKGRNGAARLARVSVVTMPATGSLPESRVVEFWSKRDADSPPAALYLTTDDAAALMAYLQKEIGQYE